ncbi:MAG: flagellar hook-length control protein FliK [candidate division Zixibacteria bacterium]|nr:flagellar hook-length control protein FliK [candidate division Zixibacteria bacterium]
MTNPGNNILNLLLGNSAGETTRVPGRDSGTGADASGFADILNLLTGGQSGEGTDGVVSGILDRREFNLLFDENFKGVIDEVTADNKETSPEQIHARNILNLINNKHFGLEGAVDNNTIVNNRVPGEPTTEMPARIIVDSPLTAVKTNKFLNDIINTQPVALESGTYLVLESAVKDGRLDLTLQPADDPTRQINVKLPVEQLMTDKTLAENEKNILNLINEKNRKRVELNAEQTDKKVLKIEELFSKLNLKELEIKNIPEEKTAASKSQNTVDVKIVAEQAGQEVVIRNKIDKNSVKTNIENKHDINIGRQASRTVSTDIVTRPVDEINSAADNSRTTAREWLLKNQKNIDDLQLFGKATGSDDNRSSEMVKEFGGLVLDKTLSTERSSNQKVDLPQVRFSLPDDIKQTLKPGGRAISIQIEPEQLGPARLHLALRDSNLSARLTVDSPQAKAAVEGSLSQLTEQLARYGIKVDYIQVGVNGGEAQNHNFARRTFWNNSSRTSNLSLEEDLFDDMETPPLTIMPQPALYVGAGGVNLLA